MSIRIGPVDSSGGARYCSWPPAALCLISLQGNSSKTVLGIRIIPFVSFSHRILSHVFLRKYYY